MVDLGRRRSTTLDEVCGAPVVLGGGLGRLLATGNIEDVQLAAGGGLDSVLNSGIMRDMVTIHDVLRQG